MFSKEYQECEKMRYASKFYKWLWTSDTNMVLFVLFSTANCEKYYLLEMLRICRGKSGSQYRNQIKAKITVN